MYSICTRAYTAGNIPETVATRMAATARAYFIKRYPKVRLINITKRDIKVPGLVAIILKYYYIINAICLIKILLPFLFIMEYLYRTTIKQAIFNQ